MSVTILRGDCRDVLRTLPDESVHCVVTSPPYFGLRDYGVAGQIGLEPTPDRFTAELVRVFAALRPALRKDGTVWLNLGDTYANTRGGKEPGLYDDKRNGAATWQGKVSELPPGLKIKDLMGIPWRVAFALQADGWYLRQDIIWSKPNPMPESVRDRCTKAHEYIFLLSKSERYYYDAEAIKESAVAEDLGDFDGGPQRLANGSNANEGRNYRKPRSAGNKSHKYVEAYNRSETEEHRTKAGLMAVADVPWLKRNKRSVWEVATSPYSEAHFATFPPALIEPCILAGCPKGGTVLDPFGGAGTTALVADRHGRNAILIELNEAYAEMAERRVRNEAGMFADVTGVLA